MCLSLVNPVGSGSPNTVDISSPSYLECLFPMENNIGAAPQMWITPWLWLVGRFDVQHPWKKKREMPCCCAGTSVAIHPCLIFGSPFSANIEKRYTIQDRYIVRRQKSYHLTKFLLKFPIHVIFMDMPLHQANHLCTGPRSAVGNVSGHRYESDCRSRGREFDPCLVPYFCGD